MNAYRGINLLLVVICAVAVVFHAFLASRSWNTFAILLAGWSLTPYLAAVLVAVFNKRPLIGAAVSGLALALDVNTYFNVRGSESSTAVLDYLWTPMWNLLLVVPLVTFLVLKFERPRHNAP